MTLELGIAHTGLSDDDIRRLRAMLLMALADGSLKGRWYETDPAAAHLLVTSPRIHSVLDASGLLNPNKIVGMVVRDNEPLPPGALKISWPISIDGMLELLQLAERRALETSAEQNVARADHPLVHLAELLRHPGTGASDRETVRIAGLVPAPIYVVLSRRQFHSANSPRALQHLGTRSEIAIDRLPLAQLPADAGGPQPLVILQWSLGLATGTLGLLPWLSTESTFRLRSFPELQLLPHRPVHRRLAAAFSHPVAGIAQAGAMTDLDPPTICSFLNAADLCGYLSTSRAPGRRVQQLRLTGGQGLAQPVAPAGFPQGPRHRELTTTAGRRAPLPLPSCARRA
jgi:hypothetical protein